MKKVSIIIPVYNAEKYIARCLNSVLMQKYQNIEIVIVNDGSKDNSLKILLEYEKKYPNKIKLISQENAGEGMARNEAFKHVTGDYITFLDSDDWIENDYILTLINEIGDNDIIVSGFERYNSKYQFQYSKHPMNNDWAKFKFCSVAGKLFKFSFIRNNKLIFEKFMVGEDCYFNINSYCRTKKISTSAYAGYCNYENLSSVTNVKKYDKDKLFINVLKSINNDLPTSNINNQLIHYFYLKAIVLDVILNKDLISYKILKENFDNDMEWYKKVLRNNNCRLKIYNQPGEDFKINFLINSFVLFYKFKLHGFIIYLIKKSGVKAI